MTIRTVRWLRIAAPALLLVACASAPTHMQRGSGGVSPSLGGSPTGPQSYAGASADPTPTSGGPASSSGVGGEATSTTTSSANSAATSSSSRKPGNTTPPAPATQPPGGSSTPGVCPPPPPPGQGSCPNPCTCPDYYLNGGKYSVDSSGHVVIHYSINPSGVTGTSLTTDQIIAAINAAAATWQQADPVIQFVYDGTTAQAPALNNVVGFAPTGAPGAGSEDGGAGYPFDIKLQPTEGWVWRPCNPAHGEACTDYYTGNGALDLQTVATHEFGHVFGLGHPTSSGDVDLTMYGAVEGGCPSFTSGYTCRYADTPGYGDILGLRALYPTSAPFPTLYTP